MNKSPNCYIDFVNNQIPKQACQADLSVIYAPLRVYKGLVSEDILIYKVFIGIP